MPSSHRMIRMIAMVSSMFTLLGARLSNRCATAEPSLRISGLVLLAVVFTAAYAHAQTPDGADPVKATPSQPEGRWSSAGRFALGALGGLTAHESGHLLFDFAFDADPR